MTRKSLRIARPAAVLFAAGVVVFGGVWPASADITLVKVTDPTQSEVLAGSYESDGTPAGFKVTLKGQATTTCSVGWQTIQFKVTGPKGTSNPATQTFNVTPPGSKSWSGSAPSQWDTLDLRNGLFDVTLVVVEKPKQGVLDNDCASAQGSAYVTVKVANPAKAPEWQAAPAKASDGSASVTLRWKKNAEPDVLEYRIVRTDPGGGTKFAHVSAGSPGAQGCSLSSNVYTCEDTAFPNDYTGTYSYGLVALRERPSGEGVAECETVSKPCVASSGSSTSEVSLVAPAPTPTPTDQPSTPPPGTTAPGTPSSKPNASGSNSGRGGTRVLSFGGSNEFYSGTYSENLPYTPRSLILGGGSVTSSPRAEGYQGDVVSETAPDYRTIMLPVAGGLLAFLSAAHVRRLLLHL